MSHNRDLSAAAAQIGFHNSNIGIGTDTPDKLLTVSGANTVARFKSSTSYVDFLFQNDTKTNGYIQYNNSGNLNFYADSGSTPTLTIKGGSPGRIGINQTSPDAMLQVDYDEGNSEVGLRLRAYNASGSKTWQLSEINGTPGVFTIRNATNSQNNLSIDGSSGYVGVNNTSPERRLEVVETASSLTYPVAVSNFTDASAGVGAAIDFRLTTGGNTRGELGLVFAGNSNSDGTDFVFKPNDGSTGNVERLRIKGSSGKMGLGTNSPGSYDGEADNFVVASSDHTGITIASTGSSKRTNLYFADGTSGNERYRGAITYEHNGDYMMMRTTGTERMRILGSGHVNIGGYLSSVTNSGLHVGRNSGGTAAGESVIAATLGNDSTMVSALLTVKNAGNRGSQGHGSGSPLAKFEFNNGTAFEIDKYGRRALQYQPGCKVSIDTNSQGGGNNTQTGNTVIPFNSTGYGYNIGNHFNTTTHTFTAPLDGRYLVLLSLNVIGDNIVYIYKNGSVHQGGEYRSNPVGSWEHCELSGIVECSANDTIKTHSYLLSSSGGRKFNGGTNPGSTWDTLSIYYLG